MISIETPSDFLGWDWLNSSFAPALTAAAGRRDSPAPGCGSRLLASSVGRDARARGQRPQGGAARPLRAGRHSRPQALHGEPNGLASG